jgi:hypothetical protein
LIAMTLISIASTFAIVLGFAGTVPHIRTMVRSRSSNGQSPAGWLIGIAVNVMTGYVNLAGLGAVLLGIGNVIAGTFAAIALACVVHYKRPLVEAEPTFAPAGLGAAPPLAAAPAMHELPTQEFHVIKQIVDEEHARRARLADVERIDVERIEPARELREFEPLAA